MSTHITNTVTATIQKSKPKFVGGVTSIYWDTLEDLVLVEEIWTSGDKVTFALVTRSFADTVNPTTDRSICDEQRDHILTQRSIPLKHRSVNSGFFFGPACVEFPLADPEQEVGGFLAYSAISGRLLFFVRANPGSFTCTKPIRTTFESGIYARVRA